MMVVAVSAPSAAPVLEPAAVGGGYAASGVAVASAFDHAHEWIHDEGMIGLFHCADSSCDGHAVCPGCLHSIDVVLAAPAAGLVIYWCVVHVRGGCCRGRGRATR